jgi:hypothetical protein
MADFLTEANVRLLWEVLIDEDTLSSKPKEFLHLIFQIFQKNLIPFYETERKSGNLYLIDFNKKYISLMIDVIQKAEVQQLQKAKQSVNKVPITYEEIQEEKKTKFEKELVQKQDEFQRAVALPVPPTPNFSDPWKEEKTPISELERMIQETINERNFDLDPNHKNVQEATKWLNLKETSVKTNDSPSLKYIKIEEPLVKEKFIQPISLDDYVKPSKNVQWSEKLEESYFVLTSPNTFLEEKEDNSQLEKTLFSKLKRVPSLEKDIRIQQLEEEVKMLYQKIDVLTRVLEEKKLA